ncbi:MAG TPA: hypothetical protein ENI51_07040 [Candidatus Atribacteria bacterium]|nr:hypothetical protein [Candidatus Atribacteria bacterium]
MDREHIESYVGKLVEVVTDIPMGEYYGIIEKIEGDTVVISIFEPVFHRDKPTTYEKTERTMSIICDDIKRIKEIK